MTFMILLKMVRSQPPSVMTRRTDWPNQLPVTMIVRSLSMIIGHMTCLLGGANGLFNASSARQAAAGSGCDPPGGSHRSVQRVAGCPGFVTVNISDTLAVAGAREPE